MLKPGQRDEILRLVVAHTEHAHRWATQNPQHEIAAMADLVAYLDSITVPEGWQAVPMEPTREMIDAARQHHEGEAYLPFSLYKAMLAAAPKPGDSNE